MAEVEYNGISLTTIRKIKLGSFYFEIYGDILTCRNGIVAGQCRQFIADKFLANPMVVRHLYGAVFVCIGDAI